MEANNTNTYFLGEQLKADLELSRLIEQARLTDEAIGDVIPPSVDPASLEDVLDIGCGSGDWCIAVAKKAFPCHVVGIDALVPMIEYARAQAACSNLSRPIDFFVMNALQPLAFPDESFDLVSTRFSTSFITHEQWPQLIKGWRMLLRTGGTLSITEQDVGYTNSLAFGQILQWIVASWNKRHANFGGPFSLGTVAVLPNLFEEAHFRHIEAFTYYLNVSASSPLHERWLYNVTSTLIQLKPLLLRYQITTDQEYTKVFQQAQEDFHSPNFAHATFILNITGIK